MAYVRYSLDNHFIYVSNSNCNQIIVQKALNVSDKDFKSSFKKYHINDKIPFTTVFYKALLITIYILQHASSKFNMNCKYCLVKDRYDPKFIIYEV